MGVRRTSQTALGAVLSIAGVYDLGAHPALAAPHKASASPDIVLVTAQKRVQDLSEVPVSVDVILGEKPDAISAAGEDILFLAARSPSLYAESSSGRAFPRFYIRGLGNTDFDLNANQPVCLVYDEIILENSILKGFPVFDLDRIEILRGPQGTLFGRNIANDASLEGAIDFNNLAAFVNDPPTWGVEIASRF